jgi:starch synthase (maltosyl-transferring)
VYTIEAWSDAFETWLDEIDKKRRAGDSVALELIEGRSIVARAAERAEAADVKGLGRTLDAFDRAETEDDKTAVLSMPSVRRHMARCPDRSRAVRYERELQVVADRTAARFAAWYEMFPRSQGSDPARSATFEDCIRRLDEVSAMGFDVVYLVPIHPIGRRHRKGRNNTLGASPEDPGSPYAIGAAEGGHDAVHPELGTLADFRAFVEAARARDLEVALDFAIQCSPDHPWIEEHPNWFEYRPDGSIKYAENPPKKYQDIVNLNFSGEHRDELWAALRDTILFWAGQGVRIFRVDNPHTKPVPFWEWLIREVQQDHPDILFLSEAFTRPKMLKMLAKVGFTQSYTYFTWRNFKGELTEYLTELTQSECREYLRPNLFTNTPDILPPFLQTGGRPAFQIRLVLAATLSSVYGIYNGFELCEATAIPGTEEYQDSEKYQYKVWDWDRAGNIKDYITAVNRIRRNNPALQYLANLRFYPASDDNVLFYGKMTPERDNIVFVAVNLDPFEAHDADLDIPLADVGIKGDGPYEVEELLSGDRHLWRGGTQHVSLDPNRNPAEIFRLKAWERVDYREPSF